MSDIDYTKYGLGAIPDKFDPRDYIYEAPTGNTVYPIGFRLEKMPVKNQNTINSCVAHSIALIKETQEYYETGKKVEFSVGWLYGYRNTNDYKGQGMMPKEALTNLKNFGNVTIDLFPENFEYDALQDLINKRKNTCLSNGAKYKISSYARVTDVNSVKSCLYVRKSPVMLICNIYQSFYNTRSDGMVREPSGNLSGSHAMTVVGWTNINGTEYYIVQNSWGPEWGDNGICYIKPGSSIITDIYTIIDKENVSLSFSDVPYSYWGRDAINKCVKAGLINGYPDGTFRPNGTITRAEICSMFSKMLAR